MRAWAGFIVAITLVSSLGRAQGTCTPLADVSFSIDGLAKMSSTVIEQQFNLLKNKVNRVSGFKKILVRPSCAPGESSATTMCIAYKGIPRLDNNGVPTFDGTRPVQFDVDLKKTDFDMDLIGAITCPNFICAVKVRIHKFVVDGTITNFMYADTGEMIAVKVKPEFDLVKPAYYDLKISLNPMADNLNALASTQLSQQFANLPPGALQISLRAADSKETEDVKIHRFAEALREKLTAYRKDMQDPRFGAGQYAQFENNFILAKLSEIAHARYKNGLAPYCADQPTEAQKGACVVQQLKEMRADSQAADQALHQYFIDNHTSRRAIEAAAQNTVLPNPASLSDEQLILFFNTPPKTLSAQDFSQMYLDATVTAKSEEDGFTDNHIGAILVIADQFIQKFLPTVFDSQWQQLIKNELEPAVSNAVNLNLATASTYADQITRIPNLDLQLIERKSRLSDNLTAAQVQLKAEYAKKKPDAKTLASLQAEIKQLQTTLAALATQMGQDWLPIGINIIFDHTAPDNPKLLKGHLFEKGKECLNPAPSQFHDEDDADLITDFDLDTLRVYFDDMVQNKMLSLCIGSDDPQCKGGTAVAVTKMPVVSCVNGLYKLDLDFTIKKLLGLGAKTDIMGTFGNCKGSPCFRLQSSESRLNNSVLNLMLGGLLSRSISSALKAADGVGAAIPDLTLVETETVPASCAMRMKWNVLTLKNH